MIFMDVTHLECFPTSKPILSEMSMVSNITLTSFVKSLTHFMFQKWIEKPTYELINSFSRMPVKFPGLPVCSSIYLQPGCCVHEMPLPRCYGMQHDCWLQQELLRTILYLAHLLGRRRQIRSTRGWPGEDRRWEVDLPQSSLIRLGSSVKKDSRVEEILSNKL